jgi:hypothetical protein
MLADFPAEQQGTPFLFRRPAPSTAREPARQNRILYQTPQP